MMLAPNDLGRSWARLDTSPMRAAEAAGIATLPPTEQYVTSVVIPLEETRGWYVNERWGDLRHETGRFFRLTGLSVTDPSTGTSWEQPIIDQGDVGILGLLIRGHGDETEFLVQGKAEPGNAHGVQLAPTVQATSSNYQRAHGGRAVPYLDLFIEGARRGASTVFDVGQSEHGHRFYRKSNRNVVVRVERPVEVQDGFRWMNFDDLFAALRVDDLVGMDLRSVVSCWVADVWPELPDQGSGAPDRLTGLRGGCRLVTRRQALSALTGWEWKGGAITPTHLGAFRAVGLDVTAHGREVGGWCQPSLHPLEPGLSVLFVRTGSTGPQVLVRFAKEPGLREYVELGPSVQVSPAGTPTRPCSSTHLAALLDATPDQVLYDAWLSDEGGRFLHALVRHLIVVAENLPDSPDATWMSLPDVTWHLRRGHDVTMELRSALCCLVASGFIAGPLSQITVHRGETS